MRYSCLIALLIGAFSGNVHALDIRNCFASSGSNPLTATPCINQVNFATVATDGLDWGGANPSGFGTALTSNTWDPATQGAWTTQTTSGVQVGLTSGPGFVGASTTLHRADNGFAYQPGPGLDWNLIPANIAVFHGHFNSLPTAPNNYGDHLVGYQNASGPMEMIFTGTVHSVGFFISTKDGNNDVSGTASTSVNATIKAYTGNTPPTPSTVPYLSYQVITNFGGGANCASLSDFEPPQPCNDAPFVAIDAGDANITYLTIQTTDQSGYYVDSLYLNTDAINNGETPEPVSMLLTGAGMILLGFASKKFRVRA